MGKSPEQQIIDMVSDHAIARYVERVLGVSLPGNVCAAFNKKQLAEKLCEAVGVSIFAVCKRIMTPAVATACRLNARGVRTADCEVRIRGGIVVTIIVEDPRKRLLVLSRKETHRHHASRARKAQRRPAL